MPKVVTFSVFLPSLSSSSAVWVQPRPHHTHSNNARIFFMVPRELDRLIRHQRKRPHRAAGGHAVRHPPAGDAAAPPGGVVMVDSMPVEPVPSTNLKSTYFISRGKFHEFT